MARAAAWRMLALLALVVVGFALWLWWDMRDWHPHTELYPEQGAMIGDAHAPVDFAALRAIGAQFVYLKLAPDGAPAHSGFSEFLVRAREAGLRIGVVLPFDPCQRADAQSAFFTRMAPRASDLLPPVIALGDDARDCDPDVSDAAVESEIMTLINQVERHAGKPVILKLSHSFEKRHATARNIARDLWLERDRAAPSYAGRPWLLWSANSARHTVATEEPVEWIVVQR
ncbi:MAG: glycoside hydrolase family 25 protein [Erythrobacter sp.]|jgi:lysozyme|nr:glycoside hydrolase family 25 protein [Erythrobacter sp.]